MKNVIRIALPKGRLGEQVYCLFEKAGFGCPEMAEDSRRLIFSNGETGVEYFWVKPSDVAIYVEHGAADLGLAGSDILMEQEPEVFELLDLGLGRCRLAVAGKREAQSITGRTLRVATKFPNAARKYYAEQSREIEIIKLNGSIELAPLVGLSDVIVDLVETGRTLRENQLEVLAEIAQISTRLIAGKTAYRFQTARISEICRKLEEQVQIVQGRGSL